MVLNVYIKHKLLSIHNCTHD